MSPGIALKIIIHDKVNFSRNLKKAKESLLIAVQYLNY